MPFKKGQRHPNQGGKRGGGRPSTIQKEIKSAAARMAQKYIENHIKPVLKAYLELAGGRKVQHFNQQTGECIYEQWEVDSPTLRHWVDKLVPAVKTEIDLNGKGGGITVLINTNLKSNASNGT